MSRAAATLALALWATFAAAGAHAPLSPEQLAARAGGGGLVLLTMHAEAPFGGEVVRDANATPEFLDDCEQQRRLSEEGRVTARALGRALQRKRIRLDRVLTSPYCRARETAELVLGRARDYRLEEALRTTCFAAPQAIRERRRALEQLLAAAPAPGANTLLITHLCNMTSFARATLDWCGIRIKPGTTIVYAPQAAGFRALGCIPAETWRAWGRE